MTRPRLTPTQKKILQFVADGGERGRMLVQVISTGGKLAAPISGVRNAGYIEDAHAPVSEPDRVRITATGRAALTGDTP
jgi:hypothetical protein